MSSSSRTPTRGRGAHLAGLRRCRSTDVEDGLGGPLAQFHRPVRVGSLWIGPPWEHPRVMPSPWSSTRAARSAPARIRRRSSACELLRERAGSVLDVGCGSGVLSIAAAKLGFAPVIAVDFDQCRRGDRANAARQRRHGRGAQSASARTTCRRRDSCSRTSPPRPSALALAAAEAPRLDHSGYLVSDEPRAGRATQRAASSRAAGPRDLHDAESRFRARWRPSRVASSAARSRRPTLRRCASGSSPTVTSSAARAPTSR